MMGGFFFIDIMISLTGIFTDNIVRPYYKNYVPKRILSFMKI